MEKFVEAGKIRSLGLSNWYVKELEGFLLQVTVTPSLIQNEIHPYYQENKVISAIAQAHGVLSAQVILRWNLQKGVAVIPGSSNPDHIKENTELYVFALTDMEMEQINALDRNEKHDWY